MPDDLRDARPQYVGSGPGSDVRQVGPVNLGSAADFLKPVLWVWNVNNLVSLCVGLGETQIR